MSMYWILFIGIAIISYIVQASLQSKFKKYSKMPLSNGMTGKEVAEKMLHDNGIYDVRVTSTPGMLTDHYNPANKTVNLSEGVYGSNSVAAAAVAAHECGHAVQHARAYAPLKMRSALVPVVQFSSSIMTWVLLGGILMVNTFPQLLLAGAGAFTTLLSLRSEYAPVNIVIALVLNMVWVYVVLKLTDRIERFLGKGGIYVIRKFFGIILLAISARLFTANLTLLIEQFQNLK